ncbi:M28 family metallopeptidase [Marinicella sediminis]|uniref:M28 family metallopeptidase n=1 Tax=Marinicella sediminis TaxID=1792834 RepID=A0ABV7JAB6_9GAMM|nr:M28 family peptidase [Marinicella sediminis]
MKDQSIKTIAQFRRSVLTIPLLLLVFTAQARSDLSIIDIDGIGYAQLATIKQHPKVLWWVEMGDKMIIEQSQSTQALPAFVEVVAHLYDVDTADLVFEKTGHCSHGGFSHPDHPAKTVTNKLNHVDLPAVFSSGGYRILDVSGVAGKAELLNDPGLMPFTTDQVLVYQMKNRPGKRQSRDPAVEQLLNQVDADRWYAQVQELASHDRMEEAGMVAAGTWLEGRFAALDLTTSRIDRHGHIGFNVLGFKTGLVRPDDWYVVGAHLDSRNAFWNPNLPSPGAEDNASGCSGVLEMANVLAGYQTDASILFVCFNAEEIGLWGSADVLQYFRLRGEQDNIKFMQNLDMIAYHPGIDQKVNAGTDVAEYVPHAELLASNGNLYTDIDWQVEPNACCTDFKSFTDVGIPAISATIPNVFGYPGYHQSTDLPEYIDRQQGAGVVRAQLATLIELAGVQLDSTHQISAGHSGMWYDPEQTGHGLTVEVLGDNRIMLAWFVFDQFGQQIWLVGAGEFEGARATVNVAISSQGVFPPAFDHTNVIKELWGTLTIEFFDCETAELSWEPVAGTGYSPGTLNLSRLTAIDGLTCQAL